jgi:hypothetical protein
MNAQIYIIIWSITLLILLSIAIDNEQQQNYWMNTQIYIYIDHFAYPPPSPMIYTRTHHVHMTWMRTRAHAWKMGGGGGQSMLAEEKSTNIFFVYQRGITLQILNEIRRFKGVFSLWNTSKISGQLFLIKIFMSCATCCFSCLLGKYIDIKLHGFPTKSSAE